MKDLKIGDKVEVNFWPLNIKFNSEITNISTNISITSYEVIQSSGFTCWYDKSYVTKLPQKTHPHTNIFK